MHLSLFDYILKAKQWDIELLEDRIKEYSTLKADLFETLQKSIVVDLGFNAEISKDHLKCINTFGSHIEFVNNIVKYLVGKKINNSLKSGYIDPSKHGVYMSDIYNPSVGFQVNVIKSPTWQCISDIMGRDQFLRLILEFNVYCQCNGTRLLLCGPLKSTTFGKDGKTQPFSRDYHMFADSYEETIMDIISEKPCSNFKLLPKKFEGLQNTIKFAYTKHETFNYRYHFERYVGSTKTSSLDLFIKRQTKSITLFCLFVIKKMFPRTVWGSLKNLKTMEQLVSLAILRGEKSLVSIDKITDKFSCSKFTWIGSNLKMQNSQDAVSRKKILSRFLLWFFYKFLPDLITKFLKRITKTEGGGNFQIDYYLRNEWKSRTGEWLSNYVQLYLYKLDDEFTKATNKETSFVGVIKLIPKKEGFRMLCMPLRSRPLSLETEAHEENIRYSLHLKNVIRPLQRLLTFKDRQHTLNKKLSHPRCYSPQDVAIKINEFRSVLNEKKLSKKVYVLKFDMTKCFDNMNQDILLDSVSRLFEGDEEGKYYFVRNYTLKSIINANRGDTRKYEIKDSNTIHDLWGSGSEPRAVSGSRAILDHCTTNKFNKENVLSIVNNYVKNSAVFIEENSLQLYKRKTGVFQGFPLLATLCNIYYNQLVDKELESLLYPREGEMSMLLRLVDDFLYISTYDDRDKIFEIVNSPKFKSYGAILNEQKTAWYPEYVIDQETQLNEWSEFLFVGLKVDADLVVKPSTFYDPTQLSISKSENIDQAYSILNWWYKSQLKVHVISTRFGEDTSFDNLITVWQILISSLIQLIDHFTEKGHTVSPQKMLFFLLSIIEMSLVIWKSVNKTDRHSNKIVRVAKSVIKRNVQHNKLIEEVYETLQCTL